MIKISLIAFIPRAIKGFFYKVHNIKEAGNLFEESSLFLKILLVLHRKMIQHELHKLF